MTQMQIIVALALLLLPSACVSRNGDVSSGVDDFPATPLTATPIRSGAGKLDVLAWTAPEQPPTRGTISVKLEITDANTNAAVDGLELVVVPEMPSMGHGTSVDPVVTPKGSGLYLVSDVNLFMAGAWVLTTSITGTVTDDVSIPINVL